MEVRPPGAAARGFPGGPGFRNVLVHGYLDVNLALVQQALGERLEEFERFAVYVERYLELAAGTGSGSSQASAGVDAAQSIVRA